MSMEPQTFILFSLAVDAILAAALVFLWLRQRQEWHALFWAVGQTALSLNTLFRYLAPSHEYGHLISACTLAASIAGYWAGTEFFLGHFKRRHLQRAAIVYALLALGIYALWSAQPTWISKGTSGSIGAALLWAGFRLTAHRNRYRFLGWVLIVRGTFNLANALGFIPPLFEIWFAVTVTVKTVSMLCLIYAVQEKVQQRYAHTIDSLSNGFLILDRNGFIHEINERCVTLLGYSAASELIATHLANHLPGTTRQMVTDYFGRFETASQYPFVETTTINLRNGAALPVEMISSPYSDGNDLYCMIQLMDISERKKKDTLLYRAARYDNITGFFNRYGLSQELTRCIAEAESAGSECAVIFIDLDKFKRVNDSFGHTVGDELLRQIAQRLHGLLGHGAILGRFGGDEFVAVLPALRAGTATTMATFCGEQVMRALSTGFDLSNQSLTVSASIGMACYPEHGSSADMLIRHADIAMYDVKKHGRGELRFFDDAMNAYAKDALVIDGALRGAIEAGELRLVYQPIVDARGLTLKKVEALLRWNSASLGPVSPDRFIPVAEDSGLIVELGTWVLNEACRQVAAWRPTLGDVTISVNVSARQLVDPAFLVLVEHALARHGLLPQQLELELTERVLIDDGANVRAVLGRLAALGVSLSLDDFGTGYSSLGYLTQFQLNTLKIDRSFIMDIELNKRNSSLVAAIVAMGNSLGMKLVAEGVETAGQAAMLEQMGCHYLQGYFIARPLPPDQLALANGCTAAAEPAC